jgi:predicted RNA-binding protein with PUA-like domain
MPNHWMVKSEPSTYSISHLKRDGKTGWEGVRNYQARNTMRDLMKAGDKVLFYHSGEEAGVAGVAVVTGKPRADPSQWDPRSEAFDKGSSKEDPRWIMVDLKFERQFPRVLALAELRKEPALKEMVVLRRGNRLSVMPVTAPEFAAVERMAARKGGA